MHTCHVLGPHVRFGPVVHHAQPVKHWRDGLQQGSTAMAILYYIKSAITPLRPPTTSRDKELPSEPYAIIDAFRQNRGFDTGSRRDLSLALQVPAKEI